MAVFPNMPIDRWDWRMDRVREWRLEHRHEMPEGDAGEPAPFESSGALVEHANVEHDWHRPAVGFSPNGQ